MLTKPKRQAVFDKTGQRRLIVAGNWKMNETYREAVDLAQGVCDRLSREWREDADVVLCPPFTALRGVSNVIAFDHSAWCQVGAQDVSFEGDGAFTGQISARMIADLDCLWCIVGHSERRGLLGETDADVARKAAALQAAGITPIVCVGEGRDVYEAGQTVDHVTAQVAGSLAGLEVGQAGLVLAYEPIWAIGTGLVPSPEHAQRVANAIRACVAQTLGEDVAQAARVLYGGSVKPGNVAAFVSCPDVDGVLVGGAALDADDFVAIVCRAVEARRA